MEVCPGFRCDQAERAKAYVGSQIKENTITRQQYICDFKEVRLELALYENISGFWIRRSITVSIHY